RTAQSLAQAAYRCRFWRPSSRGQPLAQSVRANARHDEADEKRRHGQDDARPGRYGCLERFGRQGLQGLSLRSAWSLPQGRESLWQDHQEKSPRMRAFFRPELLLLQRRNTQYLTGIDLVRMAEHRLVGFKNDRVFCAVCLAVVGFSNFPQSVAFLY